MPPRSSPEGSPDSAPVLSGVEIKPAVPEKPAERPDTRIQDSKVAEEAAYHELDARAEQDVAVENARNAVSDIKTESFDNPLVDKAQLVKDAISRLEKIKGKQAKQGNEAADKFLGDRQEVTNILSENLGKLTELLAKEEGSVQVEGKSGDPENVLVALSELNRAAARADQPFKRAERTDETTGATVVELVYHTSHTDVLVVEYWDKASGDLMRADYVKGNDLVGEAAATRLDRVMAARDFYKGGTGEMTTKEIINSAKMRELSPLPKTAKAATATESSGDSGGGYDAMTGNLMTMGMGEVNARKLAGEKLKAKPKSKGFWATLFSPPGPK